MSHLGSSGPQFEPPTADRGTVAMSVIRGQPATLSGIVARRAELADVLATVTSGRSVAAAYGFGCGDGYFAADAASAASSPRAAVSYSGQSSLDFLVRGAHVATISTLLLPVSVSGNVDMTLEALARGQGQGAASLAITNSTAGRLASASDKSFLLNLNEPKEFLAGTASFTASLVCLMLLIEELQRGSEKVPRPLAARLQEDLSVLGSSQTRLEQEVGDFVSNQAGAQRVFFLGTGGNLALARYGVAKFAELTRTLAVAQDLEEFAHSYFWQLGLDDLVVVLADESSRRFAARTAAALVEFGTNVLVLAVGTTNGNRWGGAALVSTPRLDTPLLGFAIQLQLIAHLWAQERGLDPDLRDHLRDDTERFRISRQLTRRSVSAAT